MNSDSTDTPRPPRVPDHSVAALHYRPASLAPWEVSGIRKGHSVPQAFIDFVIDIPIQCADQLESGVIK